MALATHHLSSNRLAAVCSTSALALAGCLAFAAPYGAGRNADMQGLLLLVAGMSAWFGIMLTYRRGSWPIAKLCTLLVSLFLGCCLLSTVINPHTTYNILGAPHVRLGAAGFLACFGLGLTALRIPAKQILPGLYGMILAISLVSFPYTLLRMHSLERIGGVFAQADIFAIFIACGLLIGGYLLHYQIKNLRPALIATQVFLAVMLLLTATRSAIFLTAVLYPLSLLFSPRPPQPQKILLGIGVATVFFIGSQTLLAHRITDSSYAAESVAYRFDLQTAALHSSTDKPWLGYGPGNLADALDCRKLHTGRLQATCHEHYFFNSSHSIFLDRIIAVGWFGGIAYTAFVVIALYKGLRRPFETRVLAFCGVAVGLYYLTNVTNVALEVLFWILLIQCLRPVSRA